MKEALITLLTQPEAIGIAGAALLTFTSATPLGWALCIGGAIQATAKMLGDYNERAEHDIARLDREIDLARFEVTKIQLHCVKAIVIFFNARERNLAIQGFFEKGVGAYALYLASASLSTEPVHLFCDTSWHAEILCASQNLSRAAAPFAFTALGIGLFFRTNPLREDNNPLMLMQEMGGALVDAAANVPRLMFNRGN